MRTTLTTTELLALLQQMAVDMAAHKDYLCALDGAMGDGDQGVTMAIGFGGPPASSTPTSWPAPWPRPWPPSPR